MCPFGLDFCRTSSSEEAFKSGSPGCCRRHFTAPVASLEAGLSRDASEREIPWGSLNGCCMTHRSRQMSSFTRQHQMSTDGRQGHIYEHWITKQHSLLNETILWHSWLGFTKWSYNSEPSCGALAKRWPSFSSQSSSIKSLLLYNPSSIYNQFLLLWYFPFNLM